MEPDTDANYGIVSCYYAAHNTGTLSCSNAGTVTQMKDHRSQSS